MAYVEFNALVKKVNLKPKGVKEIVLEINGTALDGKLDQLSEMIDQKVEVNLDSLVVNYNVTINAKTNKPITEYKVDDKGVVSEVQPTHEQLEADLELPPEKVKTRIEEEQLDREIVDNFILSGLSPNYTDLPYDFANIVKRKIEGESYYKLANELGISSGKIVEFVDEYRKRVAASAVAWHEWKENQETSSTSEEVVAPEEQVSETVEETEVESSDKEGDEIDFESFDNEEF
ncbi:2-methylcitrate dehydratase [Bacillus sp. UNCCL81]|uniref:2-methylcitrate dehydratase n=1 Tax=Bacillus sp. UNCCL81 TaxID=1502755 RepID=UPI0008DEAFFD|nr:2-methylcitrate dehydratase [Bacillus sp. UNCCL81]SFD44541.1 hypothetical protein SAMN02799633_03844 [Bacillus sp. UNCCL81]